MVAEREAAVAMVVALDVTDAASIECGLADAVSRPGGLDILLDSARVGSKDIRGMMFPKDMPQGELT